MEWQNEVQESSLEVMHPLDARYTCRIKITLVVEMKDDETYGAVGSRLELDATKLTR